MFKRIFMHIVLPIITLFVSISIAYALISSKPKAKKSPPKLKIKKVEVKQIEKKDYQVYINSMGTVSPKIVSDLVSEVTGNVIAISPQFNVGDFFQKGDVLLEIDPRDYETNIVLAQSDVAKAKLRLLEEEARADQAKSDWDSLGKKSIPSSLLLRVPQLQEAKASLQASEAKLLMAQRNLEKTKITAPFDGRIDQKMVDLGQYVNIGKPLSRVYSIEQAIVRLPITKKDLFWINFNEKEVDKSKVQSEVEISFEESLVRSTWFGKITRLDAKIDPNSRQETLIVEVDSPYQINESSKIPLKMGLFVKAKIKGKLLQNVYLIPRSLLRNGSDVVVVTKDSNLQTRTIDVLFKDEKYVATRSGFETGDQLCMSPVGTVVNGLAVQISDFENVKNLDESK